MPVSAFLKLCRCRHLIPHLLNIEDLIVFIHEIYTPMTVAEKTWMDEKEGLKQVYNLDVCPNDSKLQVIDDEPKLMFHEFIFLLAVIATKKNNTDCISAIKIENFFVQNLEFKRIEDQQKFIRQIDFDNYDKEFIREDEYGSDADYEFEDQQTQVRKFIQQRQMSEATFAIDFEEVLQQLDGELPMIPGKPEVVQMQPRPKDGVEPIRIKFGKFKPKVKGEDGKKKKKAAAKKPPARKKDEKPPPVLRWAGPPTADPPTTVELMRQVDADLDERIFPSNIRQDQSNPGIMPVIIKEVFFPPDTSIDAIKDDKDRSKKLQEIATLIESSIVYQNTANYEMALKSLEDARANWRVLNSNSANMIRPADNASSNKLRPELELYFEMSLGSVYESSGKDDQAMACYLNAMKIRLPKDHPDEAFPYCGLGSVFYHIEEPAWALRCYLKAREIREERIGGDTVDTATVYNNLGACMFYLERNQECKAYFELANAIMDAELGPSHERTLTTARNILKSNKTVLDVKAEYRFLWSTYIPIMGGKAGKKGGKKKKGKK